MDQPTNDDVATAAELIIDSQFPSASMLMRKMKIGFAAAGHIMDRLAELGVVSSVPNGTVPRDVLMPRSAAGRVAADIRAGRCIAQR